MELGNWLHLGWGRPRRKHFGNLAHGIGKSTCWREWSVSQTFFGKAFRDCQKERGVLSEFLEELSDIFLERRWESYLERGDDL